MRQGKRDTNKYSGDGDHLGKQTWDNSQLRMVAGASDGAQDEITAADGLTQMGVFPGMKYCHRDIGHTQDSCQKSTYAI